MKKIPFLFILTLLIFNSCNKSLEAFGMKNKTVTGESIDKEFDVEFDEITVSSAIDAEMIKSNEEKVVISAPSGVMDDVVVENKGNALHIKIKDGINFKSSHKVKAKIYVNDFSVLEANSAAKVFSKEKWEEKSLTLSVSSAGHLEGEFEAGKIVLDASSAGSLKGEIWADQMESESSSAGTIEVEGTVHSAEISASSSGTFNGENLQAENVSASASSGASINVMTLKSLKADASSGGSISVRKSKNDLKNIEIEENSGGSVKLTD